MFNMDNTSWCSCNYSHIALCVYLYMCIPVYIERYVGVLETGICICQDIVNDSERW